MPLPHAHLSLARACLPYLDVDDPQAYYLASFLPDARYYLRLSRSSTHFYYRYTRPVLQPFAVSRSFWLGYTVHLILDFYWYSAHGRFIYARRLPRWLKIPPVRRFAMDMAFEWYCSQEQPVTPVLPADIAELTPSVRRILDRLHASADDFQQMMDALRQYTASGEMLDLLPLIEHYSPLMRARTTLLIRPLLRALRASPRMQGYMRQTLPASAAYFELLRDGVLRTIQHEARHIAYRPASIYTPDTAQAVTR